MGIDNEQVQRLVLEELAGVISDEDRAYLEHTIRENPEALNIYTETRAILNTPDIQEFVTKPRGIEHIFLEPPHRRTSLLLTLSMSVAAAALVCFGVFYIFRQHPSTPSAPVIASNKNILLQLPDGQTVDLSGQQGNVKAGTLTLNNTQKSLTYTAASATPKRATLTVPAGKDYKINLSDGTEVWLNATTTLQFPLTFTGDTREITINGEAYLNVAKDTKPFFVHLPNGTVQVLGTTFNVNTYDPAKVQVALVSGAVKMTTAGHSLLLKPGHEIICTHARGMEVIPFDESILLSWREGLHIFNDTPLSEVVQVLPRWFGKEVVIDNPKRRNARFTGVINRNQPVSASLELLKATNDFDYYLEGDTIHIK